jgi:hypothetical protein
MPASSVPYYSGNDINQQYQNNRNVQQNEGDMLQQYFGGQASQRQGLENSALSKSNQLYGQLEQQPGYSPEQSNAILGNGPNGNAYQNLLSGTDYQSNFLTPDEQSQIKGDPNAPGSRLSPDILDNVNKTGLDMRTGAISGAQDRLNQNYGTTESALHSAVDPNQLNVSQGYQDKSNAAAYNPELNTDQGYTRQAGMTDQEVADTAAMGGQAIGAQQRASIQDLERQAAASGNSSPEAIAAARRQFEDQGAVQTADATVNAQLAARNAQRQAATGVENTRQAANQYKTGAQLQTAQNIENARMAGAQDISNRNLSIGTQLGQIGQQNANTLLNADTANANAYQQGGLQAGQYNQTMGYNAANTAEQNASNRAGAIAANRQNTNQTNQGNQFNRGYQVNQQLSNLQGGIANQAQSGQQQVRNYYTGQQQYQGQQGNTAQSNLLQNRQQTQTGVNQGTAGGAAWELGNRQSPSIGGSLLKSAASTFGAALGGGRAQ